jgi:hypothetical protein
MRTKLRSKLPLLFVVCALLVAVPVVAAFADTVVNDVTVSTDNKTITKGKSTTVKYWIQVQGAGLDGQGGCNASDSTPATVTIIPGPSVSVNGGSSGQPAQLTFTGCANAATDANAQSVAFSSSTVGTYGIPPVAVSDAGTGTYNPSQTSFGLHVAPFVSSTSPLDGATNVATSTNVSANFSDAIDTSTVTSSTFKLVKQGGGAVTGSIGFMAGNTRATFTPSAPLDSGATYTATVEGGDLSASPQDLTGVRSSNGILLFQDSSTNPVTKDKIWSFTTAAAPTCTNPAAPVFSHSPDGSNGWYKTIPAVSASSTAGATVQYSLNAAGPFSNTAPTLGQGQTTVYAKAVSGTCSSGVTSQLYKVDTIAPSINDDGPTTAANGAGWYKSAVTNQFTASDATSGLPASFTNPFTKSSGTDEGSAVNINSGPVSDNAGNTKPGIDSAAFKIDMTNPVANCDSAPTSWSATDVSIRCQPTDALSGLANTADGDFNLSTSVDANTETSNASTNSRPVADAAGNSVTAGPITGLKVDKKAPTYLCDADDGSWHNDNVSIACTGSDGGSGITPASDQNFNLTTGVAAGAENANASTDSKVLTDGVGHTTTAGPITGIKVDKKAPSFNCGSADADWHATDVDIACTASDGGSGLANAGDSNFNLSTTVASGVENSNASTDSRTVLDAAGNSATAGPIAGNKVDKKAPSFNCGSADTDWHADNVSIACTANDGGSGLNPTSDANFNLSTTVAAGNENSNASTGTKDLTDDVGNNATAGPIAGNKVDKKAPALVSDGPTTNPNGAGWYKTAVINSFTATDGGSGFAPSGELTHPFNKSSGTNEEGAAVKIASGAVSDAVGNSTASIDSAAFKIDLTKPTNIAFQGGPAAGTSYDFSSVPAAPTCTADDALSGLTDLSTDI